MKLLGLSSRERDTQLLIKGIGLYLGGFLSPSYKVIRAVTVWDLLSQGV